MLLRDMTITAAGTKSTKDGRVTTITLQVQDIGRGVAGDLAVLVGTRADVEINPHFWEQDVPHERQTTMEGVLSETCAVCGHSREQHKLDPNLCLGDDGACTCAGFVSRAEAESDSTEGAEVVEPMPARDDICLVCGHTYERHAADCCNAEFMGDDGVESLCVCPGFQPLLKEEYPVEGDNDALASDADKEFDAMPSASEEAAPEPSKKGRGRKKAEAA